MEKIISPLVIIFMLLIVNGCKAQSIIENNFQFAEKQYLLMLSDISDQKVNPRTIDEDGKIKLVDYKDWTSGFFPGGLWYLFEFTKDENWKSEAEKYSDNIIKAQFDSTTHDVGFKMFCSFGNGYRLTKDENYKNLLLESARTLSSRFNEKVGCIRSWDHHEHLWEYPVIIDNMMNLELLFWATKISGDSSFYNIAVTHANTTIKNHFREDYGTYHVINYDKETGEVLNKNTHQGYSDESTWARGEAWALYGYTMCFRETQDEKYLKQAENIAEFILNNKNLPKDMIPYWDFNAPNIPNEERDVSAATIICSALYELSSYLPEKQKKYLNAADTIFENLSSSKYRAEVGENGNFLLKHSVGSKPGNSEIDVPLIYADYYFLEANLRKLEFGKNQPTGEFSEN